MAARLTPSAFEDLTARARIREAAISLFAERGIEATTVRDIATVAGVSPGLLRHHFGSKEDLRRACDAHVLAWLMEMKEQAILEGRLGEAGFMSSAQPALLVSYRYLARSMIDGSPSAAAMFDEMVELAEQWLAEYNPGEVRDPRASAALLIAMETGVLFMHEQMSRALGVDVFSPEGHVRLTGAKLDFYSQPILRPELAELARSALAGLRSDGGGRRPRGGARAQAPRRSRPGRG